MNKKLTFPLTKRREVRVQENTSWKLHTYVTVKFNLNSGWEKENALHKTTKSSIREAFVIGYQCTLSIEVI